MFDISDRLQADAAERIDQLDGLIEETARQHALYDNLDPTSPRVAQLALEKHWLILERSWLTRGHPLKEWPAYMADMQAKQAASALEAKAKAKERAESDAVAAAALDAAEAKARAQYEQETDPFNAWKRKQSRSTW